MAAKSETSLAPLFWIAGGAFILAYILAAGKEP
jgi:hypothetical protein